MKITRERLKQIIKEELQVTLTNEEAGEIFGEEIQQELEEQEQPLAESIDADVLENLEAAIGAVYNQMTTPTDVDQVYADTGEPVSKDPEVMHQEAVEMIMHIVTDVTGIKGDLQEQ